MEYEIHESALIFPPMDEDELDQLASDIQQHGLIEPIALYQGKILDGRNRLRACEMVGVEPRFIEVGNTENFIPLIYVVSKNLHRRHLTPAQRAAIALDLLPYFSHEAEVRVSEGQKALQTSASPKTGSTKRGKASERVAELVGLGKTSIESAMAINRRDKKVVEAMRAGEVNIQQAARAVGLVGRGGGKDGFRLESAERDALGRSRPIYFGKGDKWKEVFGPLVRYLGAWEKRDYEFRHVNPKEARRRLLLINEVIDKLNGVQRDLEQRAHSATLTIKKG